jgi:hypothetical protein
VSDHHDARLRTITSVSPLARVVALADRLGAVPAGEVHDQP